MATIEEMVPKCCYTCCEFSKEAKTCRAHGAVVPDDFLGEIDACSSHNREPF